MRGRVGWGGGARVWACVFDLCSPRGPFLCLSLTPLFSLACLALFFLGGGAGWGAVRGCWCVRVLAPVWAWVSWGIIIRPGGCCALGSLCVRRPPGFRFPGRRSGGG